MRTNKCNGERRILPPDSEIQSDNPVGIEIPTSYSSSYYFAQKKTALETKIIDFVTMSGVPHIQDSVFDG